MNPDEITEQACLLEACDVESGDDFQDQFLKDIGLALWQIAFQLSLRNEKDGLLVGRGESDEAAAPTEAKQ